MLVLPMNLQVTEIPEILWAEFTLEIIHSCVCCLVLLVSHVPCEAFTAHITVVHVDALVSFHVSLVAVQGGEHFTTYLTAAMHGRKRGGGGKRGMTMGDEM